MQCDDMDGNKPLDDPDQEHIATLYADPDRPTRTVFLASQDNYTISEGTLNRSITNTMKPNLFKVLKDNY